MSVSADFAAFFRELWGYHPFPWQTMLAERVAGGRWPQALDLPTASGKTACIEVALWALASQADRPLAERTAPRRIWFVVDRRIVVDEAFARAEVIAGKLASPSGGPLGEVADRLRRIAGTDRPLAVARLRGGVFLDDGWARLPSQPAVITSTVDQLGSRLLFRGYGRSHLSAPIFAGLAANDSLVLLDEAHCSVPFLQTLRAIETYRGERWAESPLPAPFAFVVLSATPPSEVPQDSVFPGAARGRALDHPVLRKRLDARKPATLVQPLKTDRRVGQEDDPLVVEAARRAQAHLAAGKRRVAVMVNRVRTAGRIADALREAVGENADVVLLTGRMRPYERDQLVNRWARYLKAASPEDSLKPILVVSTQCLEVGADFSFDALVTEAASLDALRQRFGRLDRMGIAGTSPADILIRDRDADPEECEPDAVYGKALARTWRLLNERAGEGGPRTMDFGVEALRARLADLEDLSPYLAPTADAPVLLPAHLDLLCQTAPTPHPEPDVQLFLHGKERGAAEVRVVWRADLDPRDDRAWIETIALCRPASGEMLAMPIYRVRSWLAESDAADDVADLQGVPRSGDGKVGGRIRRCLLWRGQERSKVAQRADEIMPGEVVVVPAAYGMVGLGQSAPIEALGQARLDLWEPVTKIAGRPAAVRLHWAALEPWLGCAPLSRLVALAEAASWDRAEIQEGINAVLEYQPADDGDAAPPSWWLDLLRETRHGRFETHPAGGLVLFRRGTTDTPRASEPDLFADDDDLTCTSTRGVSLEEHSGLVKRTVEKLAGHCLPEEYLAVLSLAAWWHDAGKLDERFQILLHQGDELATLSAAEPLAKSAFIPASPGRRRALREASGLPESFRHEMLSAQIAERYAPLPDERDLADLLLHLVASHHGHARPFAPISADPGPPVVEGRLGGTRVVLSAEERARWIPHRLDSGLADRFWRLTRRYGWWGLAYLEAIVRLGDWYASGLMSKPGSQVEAES